MFEVSGTTWTRLRNWFEASLLTITAGRFFLTSPPTAGSKLTHQTSPRFMRDVRDGGFCPLMSFCLASLVGRHFAIGRDEVPADDMRADEGFDEAADLVAPDNLVKTRVDLFVHRDGEFLLHTYSIRIQDYCVKAAAGSVRPSGIAASAGCAATLRATPPLQGSRPRSSRKDPAIGTSASG